MIQIAIRILISMITVIFICYILFCMFLSGVAMPNELGQHKYKFYEAPKGFTKISRVIGNIIFITISIMIPVSMVYILLFQ